MLVLTKYYFVKLLNQANGYAAFKYTLQRIYLHAFVDLLEISESQLI